MVFVAGVFFAQAAQETLVHKSSYKCISSRQLTNQLLPFPRWH